MPNSWFHTIEFPDGEVVKGRVDYRGARGDRFLVPQDFTGKSVLDFGTWNGFWAIEAKKRGAIEVVATDRWDPILPTAERALGAFGIPYFYTGNLDYPGIYPPEWLEHFDVVLFFGILYHLKNPYMGLMNAVSCCKPGGMVIVESAVNQGRIIGLPENIPLLWVIDEIVNNDPTNYYIPNAAGVMQLCRMAGLEPTEQTDIELKRFTVICKKVSA